ncbi:MAG TPA: glycosyltransferase family 2 protein [Cellvibrio sp.]|nr:glycosyltransferase family 2 protein [Cellvibrio sp.]
MVMSEKKSISIVVPMYNEEAVFHTLFRVLEETLSKLDVTYEVICVDDGSRDKTRELLLAKTQQDPRVKAVLLSRNFGKEAAMTAAIDYATGDAVIPIDADLQDPPELIGQMIEKWREGFDVVYAKRVSRMSDTPMKRNTAGLFYRIFNMLSEIPIPENVGDYRLMDRRVVDAIKRLPEKDRFMKGLFCWPGFNNTSIEFERPERLEGETKFNYWKLWNFALNGITSFSSFPVRLGVYLGLIVSAVAFIYGVVIMVKTLFTGVDVPGYASLMIVVLFMGGIQLFFLGLLGEYIGRIYKEVKNRPIYMVDKALGFDGKSV